MTCPVQKFVRLSECVTSKVVVAPLVIKHLNYIGAPKKPENLLHPPTILRSHMLRSHPFGKVLGVSGPAFTTRARYAHTDLRVPDFEPYRRKSNLNLCKKSGETIDDRQAFTYTLNGLGLIASFGFTKFCVIACVTSMWAAADVLALAQIEVKLSEIPEGQSNVYKWRGKPLYVKHRTPKEIETERAVPLSTLRDPQTDQQRTIRPDFLVVLGVCTHLGCVPIANSGDWPGGFYCPCHGSHFDAAGRIRKGPAPTNLEVPVHSFVGDDILIVG